MKRGHVYRNSQGIQCNTWADFGKKLHDDVTYWMCQGEGKPRQITYTQYRNRVKMSLDQSRELQRASVKH